MMGGEIWLVSEPRMGSTFHFSVELRKQVVSGPLPGAAEADFDGLRVLVVDDSEPAREAIVSMLTAMGMRVSAVASAAAGLDLLTRTSGDDRFRLVLVDWKMPGQDGLEMVHAMTRCLGIRAMPLVIMMTAFGRDETADFRQTLPIRSVIAKPMTPSSLFDGISSALGRNLISENQGAAHTLQRNRNLQRLKGARILLVEDNDINQELAVELLSGFGMAVVVAGNGQEALDRLDEQSFDGILMDCQMPVMDGYTATRKLRQQERFRSLPVIALTANVMAGDREKVLRAGMNDHIPKPIKVDELLQVMAKWITSGEHADVFTEPSESANTADSEGLAIPELVGVDTAAALARLQGNSELYLRLLRKFADGQRDFARELTSATHRAAWAKVQALLHSMKGISATIGADALAETCAMLEAAVAEEHRLEPRSLDNLRWEFATVLDSVSGFIQGLTEHRGANREPGGGEDGLQEALELTLGQLQTFDVAAVDQFSGLQEALLRRGYGDEIKQLEQALKAYDFEGAERVVEQLCRELAGSHRVGAGMAIEDSRKVILVVDDTTDNIDVLVETLKPYYRVQAATSGETALKIVARSVPDLILLDVMMPGMDGYEVCRRLKADYTTRHIPVIFVTARVGADDELRGLEVGGVDYITKPVNPPIVMARVRTQMALHDQNRELDQKVRDQTRLLHETRLQVIQRLGRAAEYKDNETGLHVIRMSHYSRILGLAAGMGETEADLLMNAAPMHDIGKIGIPDQILQKPGRLTDEEMSVMKRHCEIGAEIIGDDDSDLLRLARTVAMTHHEKWNGQGYPVASRGMRSHEWDGSLPSPMSLMR